MNMLLKGDCIDMLAALEHERVSVSMVIADLPYGTTQNKWDSQINMTSLWAGLERVCLDSAAVVFTASQPFTSTEYLIKTYTNEDDLVLDPCAGSGTTAVACLNTGRRYVCIEMDDTYFATMQKRIAEHQPPTRDLFAVEMSD